MNAFIKFLLCVVSVLLLSSLLTMIAVFMGMQTPMIVALLSLQSELLLPLIVFNGIGFLGFYKTLGWRHGLRELWKRTPAWVVFAAVMINSLVISGFLACYLVLLNIGHTPSKNEITPLLFALFSSLAFIVTFTYLKQNKIPSTYAERNEERGSKPLEWEELWK